MRFIQFASFVLFLVMTASLGYGLYQGTFWEDGRIITNLLWGNLTLVDFYVGAFYICAWVAFRERSWWRASLWIIFVLGLGNWTTSLYVFIVASQSNGDWKHFFVGKHKS